MNETKVDANEIIKLLQQEIADNALTIAILKAQLAQARTKSAEPAQGDTKED